MAIAARWPRTPAVDSDVLPSLTNGGLGRSAERLLRPSHFGMKPRLTGLNAPGCSLFSRQSPGRDLTDAFDIDHSAQSELVAPFPFIPCFCSNLHTARSRPAVCPDHLCHTMCKPDEPAGHVWGCFSLFLIASQTGPAPAQTTATTARLCGLISLRPFSKVPQSMHVAGFRCPRPHIAQHRPNRACHRSWRC